eukprot:scaffold44204_cov176-Amphora_coffeaeformis.AAC.1
MSLSHDSSPALFPMNLQYCSYFSCRRPTMVLPIGVTFTVSRTVSPQKENPCHRRLFTKQMGTEFKQCVSKLGWIFRTGNEN